EAVERIKCRGALVVDRRRTDLREHPALRRLGVDVVEILEIGRILEIAERREAMPLGFVRGLRTGTKAECPRSCGARADAEKRAARKSDHERPALPALD